MKAIRLTLLAVFLVAASSWAVVQSGGQVVMPGGGAGRSITTLDEQCVIDFVGFTYGTNSGTMTWPGGSGEYRLTGLCFTNSCTPDEPFCTFCVDLDHLLYQDPYCVNIDSLVVRAGYAEQYPAMAYVLTWYSVVDAQTERTLQLALWKLSNDERVGSATHMWPWYYVNDGRGYPDPLDPPVFPFVNTVYNSDALINDPANAQVLNAIGYGPDGLAKNVILCDDQLLVSYGDAEVDGGIATVPVTVRLERGASAATVNNLSVGGVRLDLTVDNGTLSMTSGHTNAAGEIYFTVSQPVGTDFPSTVQICSRGLWPRKVTPCDTTQISQQLLVQSLTSGSVCTLCVNTIIPPDQFLAVNLTSFSAVSATGGIELSWVTAAENNADRWIVERRESGDRSFNQLAVLEAQNSSSGASYSYLDRYVQAGVRYDYRLIDVDLSGARTVHDERVVSVTMGGTSYEPGYYELSDNFPNPFNPETTIRFVLGEQTMTTLTVYDLTGAAVATLVNATLEAGSHSVTFDAAALPSGTYFYKLVTPGYTATKKMVLMK